VLDPFEDATTNEYRDERVVVELGDHLMLHPGQFILGSTLEFVRMPTHMVGQVLGRSSWARLGLIVATAVVVQPGFGGVLTLELVNMGNVPMKLRPGLRIAQLMVWHLGQPTSKPYEPASKYGSPIGPEPSRLVWESAERDRLIRLGELLSRGSTPEPPEF
jgi:dCTP deaminase